MEKEKLFIKFLQWIYILHKFLHTKWCNTKTSYLIKKSNLHVKTNSSFILRKIDSSNIEFYDLRCNLYFKTPFFGWGGGGRKKNKKGERIFSIIKIWHFGGVKRWRFRIAPSPTKKIKRQQNRVWFSSELQSSETHGQSSVRSQNYCLGYPLTIG